MTFADLDSLLRGMVNGNFAYRLGDSILDVEEFIKGAASAAMTERLRLNAMDAGEESARAAGRDGAIGIVIGLLIASGWNLPARPSAESLKRPSAES